MKRKFTKLMIGLVIVVLILCAVLPWVVANIGDRLLNEKVYSAELKTVQLAKELTDLEKIYLLNSGLKMEITDERTRLKTEDMKEVLAVSVEPYINESLIQGTIDDFDIVSCEPYRYYSDTISNLSGTFWEISLISKYVSGEYLELCLDDQSGSVLQMMYEYPKPIFSKEKLPYSTNQCVEVYKKNGTFNDATEGIAEYTDKNDSVASKELYNNDSNYGENGVMFTVTDTGIYIYVENSEFNPMRKTSYYDSMELDSK